MTPYGSPVPDVTVLICTFNRAVRLSETLDTLAEADISSGLRWEVIVVDNNSTDRTRAIVESRAASYPAPLRYLFEPRQGKSNALNTGIAASRARVIAFTDDDVRLPPGWLEAAARPLFEREDIDYTGGPVRPIWEAPKPGWLDEDGNLGGTIAVKNHGPEPFVFEEQRKTPLGVNMAVKRSLVDRIGGFRPDLGRRGRSLLGQEQAEFFCRARAAGARGLYVPEMTLEHHVPAARLTRGYFRRWWFWKGISHARLHRLQPVTEVGLDLRGVPRVLRVPRYLYGSAARHARAWLGAAVSRDPRRRAEHAMMLLYFAGYLWECRRAPASENGRLVTAASGGRPDAAR
jgi:glycosyltransferase involved in cell wall biosynthesis